MSLSEAIVAVQEAETAYTNAASTTAGDQVVAAGIEAQLSAAQTQVATDQADQTAAANNFNAALDALIQAAEDAKIQASTGIRQ